MLYSNPQFDYMPVTLITRRTATGFQHILKRPDNRPQRRVDKRLSCADWFKQGGACRIIREWQESDGWTQRTVRENVKGRILGQSRRGRVWVLVHFIRRKPVPPGTPNPMDKWWELRLVDADEIEPLDAGIEPPPALPPAWAKQLPSMSFDIPASSR